MAGITFSEQEIKKLILALAGSKAVGVEDAEEKPEDKPEEKDSEGKPFDTKAMLEKKLKDR
jgi:hypothetical protein